MQDYVSVPLSQENFFLYFLMIISYLPAVWGTSNELSSRNIRFWNKKTLSW